MGYVPPPLIPLSSKPDFHPPGQQRGRGPTCEYCGTADVFRRCENCGAPEPRPKGQRHEVGHVFGAANLQMHDASGLTEKPKFPEDRRIQEEVFWQDRMTAATIMAAAIFAYYIMGLLQ